MFVWFNMGSWSEFIELTNDQSVGLHLDANRYKPSMIPSNESSPGRQITVHSDQSVQLWYHREDESPSESPNPSTRVLRIDYQWEESNNL